MGKVQSFEQQCYRFMTYPSRLDENSLHPEYELFAFFGKKGSNSYRRLFKYSAALSFGKATGRDDVRMNVCRWAFPGAWVRDVATSWRATTDINPSWESVRNIIAENLYLSAYIFWVLTFL